jgi:predicted ATPase
MAFHGVLVPFRMIFLSGLRRKTPSAQHSAEPVEFPLSLPLIRDLDEIRFTTPITFLVGENGSGKSTLLEGIAAGLGAVAVGGHDLQRDPSLEAARRLADAFLFARRRHARTRLFLRAEDVFGFTNRVASTMAELSQDEAELATDLPEGYGRLIATGAVAAQRGALVGSYGANPDGRSHGETFLALLRRRVVPNGLYLLDEPETPLSPSRVLALMALLAERVGQGCQFIIATHSPILMAMPDATILLADQGTLRPVEWTDVEHVRVTRAFLADPQAALRKLLG